MESPPQSVTELCQALVRIPSVNPDGDPGVVETGEAACAAYVDEFLRHCGAKVVLEEVLPDLPEHLASFLGQTRGGVEESLLGRERGVHRARRRDLVVVEGHE